MRTSVLSILILCTTLISVFSQEKIGSDSNFPILKGPYLGQKPPTNKAELFAPDIISTNENEAILGIFNYGTYIIYERIPHKFSDLAKIPVYIIMESDGQWKRSSLTKHIGKPWYYNYPAPKEGEEIFYAWWLPLNEEGGISDINIWNVTYNNSQWGTPEKLQHPINTKYYDTWPSVTNNGVLYFFSDRDDGFGKCDIYRSIPENGKYKAAENLGKQINTNEIEGDPYVSADGSFLIFTSYRKGGFGKDDLYVSFQKENGEWSKPANLGENVNSKASDNRPYLSPDGKYLFFTSTRKGNQDIYWVDIRIIEELRPEELK